MAGEKGSYQLCIKSNDGLTSLKCISGYFGVVGEDATLSVTKDGLMYNNKATYLYLGRKIFKGLATSANATEPTYPVGTTFTYKSFETYIYFYIVESNYDYEFDLSTLNLSPGSHEITVKARAEGYADSAASNKVNYVVGEYLEGTYLFNESPNIDQLALDITFESGGAIFNRITFQNGDIIYERSAGNLTVYSNGVWTNEGYRYIYVDEPVYIDVSTYDLLSYHLKSVIDPLYAMSWMWYNQFSTILSSMNNNSEYSNANLTNLVFKYNGKRYHMAFVGNAKYNINTYKLYVSSSGTNQIRYIAEDGSSYFTVYSDNKWKSDSYRTITIDVRITSKINLYTLYEILNANATLLNTIT